MGLTKILTPNESTSLENSGPSAGSLLSAKLTNTVKRKGSFRLGSFEVAKSIRITQIIIAVIHCFLSAGIIFGYAALKPILIEEHAYRGYCTQEELDLNVHVCVKQEIRLNLMFTVAAVGTNVSALPVGTILDKYGPRNCAFISAFFLSIGALLFAFSPEIPFDGYLIGYLFLAIGGAFTYIPYLHLSNTFPKHSGLIMALISGAFDSSSALFLMYKNLYFVTEKIFGPKKFFLTYLVVPVFIFFAQLLYMPKVSYKSIGETKEARNLQETVKIGSNANERTALLREDCDVNHSSVTPELGDYPGLESVRKQEEEEEKKNRISGVWGVLHGKTVKEQIFSLWFLLTTLFTVLQMTRINYFIATVRPQYEYILGSYQDAVLVNAVFDTALPLGGLIAIPFIGIILDNLRTVSVFFLIVTTTTFIGFLGCLPYKWAAYSNIVLFVLYRPFFYTSVSDFSAKIYGFRTFGTIYGLMICLAGLFNFTANGLDQLRYQVFHRNPVPINIFLIIIAFVVGATLCFYVNIKSDSRKKEEN